MSRWELAPGVLKSRPLVASSGASLNEVDLAGGCSDARCITAISVVLCIIEDEGGLDLASLALLSTLAAFEIAVGMRLPLFACGRERPSLSRYRLSERYLLPAVGPALSQVQRRRLRPWLSQWRLSTDTNWLTRGGPLHAVQVCPVRQAVLQTPLASSRHTTGCCSHLLHLRLPASLPASCKQQIPLLAGPLRFLHLCLAP